uniref:Iso-IS1 insB n=1 Tax=Escherichia coli TaxID=562 RepID=Q6YGS5_ECOLX|nr:Iso-IS1 insB [Escherichia coli]
MLFNEGTDDFFVDFNGTREADCFTYQPLDAGAEGQVVTSIRCGRFAGQVFSFGIFWVAAPVIGPPCRYRTSQQG